jgi:rhodanese-related sulfurtransferase
VQLFRSIFIKRRTIERNKMPKRRNNQRQSRRSSRSTLTTALRRPLVQVSILVAVGLIIFLIASLGGEKASSVGALPASVSVDQAYQMYQDGTFVLDVRTTEEWNEFHAPKTTLIPLDELASRSDELPKNQPILVVCRSGNRSQAGRDILRQAGYDATSMTGGLNEWKAKGYSLVSGP